MYNWLIGSFKTFRRIINSATEDMVERSHDDVYNIHQLRDNPVIRDTITKSSIYEDHHNSQYTGILNTLSNHTIGTIPLPVPMSDSDTLNDAIEDRWREWAMYNKVGSALREARRKACQTGVCVLIPYKSRSDYELKLAYRVVGRESLKSPSHLRIRSFLSDPFTNQHTHQSMEGIEFYKNGEVKTVWVQEKDKLEPTPYHTKDGVLVWFKESRPFKMWPECTSAFTIIPSMTRFLQNVTREQELKTAIPMAVKLSDQVYKPVGTKIPKGSYKYEPGTIPTLPPGCDLVGVAMQSMAEDRAGISDKFCAVAARCIDMPRNLALSDSSSSNMATAHIDLQPWKYVVDIDRFDFEPITLGIYYQWYSMASLTTLLPPVSFESRPPPTLFNYTVLFNHPDPQKNATARATDLTSGASTLSIIFSEQSRNARREIEKEARLFGVSKEKLLEVYLASRSKQAGELLNASKENLPEGEDVEHVDA